MPPGEKNRAKTHCPQGHAYAGDNLYVYTGANGREQRYCRACLRERRRAYVAKDENRERLRLREAQRTRSRKGLNRDLHLQRMYGITLADEQRMLEEQNHRCATCLRERRLVVDHCHETMRVRGLLCSECNTALGRIHDDVEVLRRMIDYLS